MKALVLGGALFALADAMATPAGEGFERDVVRAARRSLQDPAPRRPNDINICENVGAYENTIPVSQVTGTIHDDAVRGHPCSILVVPLSAFVSRRLSDALH